MSTDPLGSEGRREGDAYVKRVALVLVALLGLGSGQSWPVIKPVAETFKVESTSNVLLQLPIPSSSGHYVYRIVCRDGAGEDPDFNYSGLLQCRLVDLGSSASIPDLLAQPGAGRDWLSRGRFLFSELTGNCAEDPDWGRQRTFLLRGVRLTLQADNLVAEKQEPDAESPPNLSYRFSIQAEPEPSATSPDDARVALPGEGSNCTAKKQWWSAGD